MVIYADVLMMVNLLADYALLLVVRRLLHLPAGPLRLLAGAGAGGTLAVVLVALCLPAWGSLLLAFPGAALVCAAAFWPLRPRELLRAAAGYFLAGFLFAGMLLSVRPVLPGLYIQNNIVYYPVSLPVFFVLLCLLYGASVLLSFLLGETPPARLFCTLRLVQEGTEVSFRAKIDTGCALREPFSGRPVVLVSAAALGEILPAPLQAYLAGEKPAPGLRLIPYDTVNGSGLLPAFFPEELLDENGRPLHGCVAVTGRAFGGTGFSAVVNPALLRDDA
ncbi:MAG: sigma-E processing peptidase SpoIIGA [Clostridia bacterium]|nr:sigma-E processing peptidase SpoIIGA [Clostridia bacterium]